MSKVDLGALSQCSLLLGRPKPHKGQYPVSEEDVVADDEALEEEEGDEEGEHINQSDEEEERDDDVAQSTNVQAVDQLQLPSLIAFVMAS